MKIITKTTTTVTGVKTCVFTFFLVLFTAGQVLYAQEDPREAIKKTITVFFDGFSKGDSSLVASVSDKNLHLQTIIDGKEGGIRTRTETRQHLMESVAKIRNTHFEERIVSWDIRVDGGYANAWCAYEVFIDSASHHYGTDNFQLVCEYGQWRILSVTDTRRKSDPRSARITNDIRLDSVAWHLMAPDKFVKEEINGFMDRWHRAAATADEVVFFGSMDSTGIYLGTDKTEHWTRPVFEVWSKKYFDRDKAWDFKPYDRHIYLSDLREYAWFDELLETWMGVCRGSGVLHWENGRWKIMHYHLSVTVPNEKMKKFVKLNK